MAEQAGVEVHLVELDVADDDVGARRLRARSSPRPAASTCSSTTPASAATPSPRSARRQLYLDVMNVNLCGAVRCLQAVLPRMRERGSGAIVNITSITGRMAAIAQSPYVASKYAFEGVSEGLAQELAPFGIRVVIIEPGVTKSAIFAKSVDAPNADRRLRRARTGGCSSSTPPGIAEATDPFEVAKVIHHAVTTDEPQLRYADELGRPGAGRRPGGDRRRRLGRPRRHRRRRRVLRPLRGALRRRHRPRR